MPLSIFLLLPTNAAAAIAATPALICTTAPPAKSKAPNLNNQPLGSQTQ